MQRTIKFRVWDKHTNQWLNSVDIYPNTAAHIGFEVFRYPHRNIVFQQFTGFVDRQGREIYEGDIVEYCNYEPIDEQDWNEVKEIGTVEFIASEYGGKLGFEVVGKIRDYYGSWPEEVNVIGNVFENALAKTELIDSGDFNTGDKSGYI